MGPPGPADEIAVRFRGPAGEAARERMSEYQRTTRNNAEVLEGQHGELPEDKASNYRAIEQQQKKSGNGPETP